MNHKFYENLFLVGTTAWLTITTFTQHPNRSFDRLRSLDRYTLTIPNWRFFAPNPATHDFIFGVRYRLIGEDEPSDWEMINAYTDRRISHMIYYPHRRVEKSLSDISGRVLEQLARHPENLSESPDYKLLVERARAHVGQAVGDKAEKFQFLLAADSGYDTQEDLHEYYVSPGIDYHQLDQ